MKKNNLPFLPMTCVGSFPKPERLVRARSSFAQGKINKEELDEIEKLCTLDWITFQEDIGIDVIVDGEQYRGDMAAYFAENLEGFTQSGFVESYDNRFYKKPIINGKVKWWRPITIDNFRFAQASARKPVKAIVTGPYTMYHWSFDEYYESKEKAIEDLAMAVKEEVKALRENGAYYIQIDEPAMSAVPEDFPLVKKGLEIVCSFKEVKYFTHICYGEFDKIYPQLLELPIHNYDLEIANRNFHIYDLLKQNKFTKELSLGVIDVHTYKIETKEQIKDLILKALTVVPIEQLWISPDCGLKTRTIEEAKEKLKVMSEVVKELRQNL